MKYISLFYAEAIVLGEQYIRYGSFSVRYKQTYRAMKDHYAMVEVMVFHY